ncbi:MAG TPA: transglycosylase SLT domain-containing protein [Terriglobales bacterium]|jgi:hypothetical protein|nr:transglycosylase SLT domain-containing protein [Terriglobales bacterium]
MAGQVVKFNPVAEVRLRYPGLVGSNDQTILQHLSDPNKFRSAFPEYGHLNDATIRHNMGQYSASARPEQLTPAHSRGPRITPGIQDDQRYETIKQQQYRGVAPSKDEQIWAKAYEKRKAAGPATNAVEAAEHHDKGLLAPEMGSGTIQPGTLGSGGSGMADTRLGGSGTRAGANLLRVNPAWQVGGTGTTAGNTQPLLPNAPSSLSRPAGYSPALSGRPQLSVGTYGNSRLLTQNAIPTPSARPTVPNDRDYVESIQRQGALQGMAGLYGIDPVRFAEIAGVAIPTSAVPGGPMGQNINPQWSQYSYSGLPIHSAGSLGLSNQTAPNKMVAPIQQLRDGDQSGQVPKKGATSVQHTTEHRKTHRQPPSNLPTTVPQQQADPKDVEAQIAAEAKKYGIPLDIALAVADQESSFNINMVNPLSYDYGLMQVNWTYFPTAEKLQAKQKKIAEMRKSGKAEHQIREQMLKEEPLKDENGVGIEIDQKRVLSDWKYNLHIGMAILRDNYRFAKKHAKPPTPENIVRLTYARYNSASWKQYEEIQSEIYRNVYWFVEKYNKYTQHPITLKAPLYRPHKAPRSSHRHAQHPTEPLHKR